MGLVRFIVFFMVSHSTWLHVRCRTLQCPSTIDVPSYLTVPRRLSRSSHENPYGTYSQCRRRRADFWWSSRRRRGPRLPTCPIVTQDAVGVLTDDYPRYHCFTRAPRP